MKGGWQTRLFLILTAALVLPPLLLTARQNAKVKEKSDEERFVRLMSANSVSVTQIGDRTFRKAEGPARFFHNNTWLICDTALWDVDAQVIYATGNVSIEQDRTEIISDNLTYFIDRNVAEFRGSLVELRDKDHNTLRTINLDYNTKDSVAVFREGGAMKDKKGQIIESLDGTYEAKLKKFTFENNVNMFSDSIFVKTSYIVYESDKSLATYPDYVEAWKDDGMISGYSGWYDKDRELLHFHDRVHALTREKEAWCDSLFYYKLTQDAEMFGNAQITDSIKGANALAGIILYVDSLSRVTLTADAAVCLETEENQKDAEGVEKTTIDTVFIRADSIIYFTVKRCEVDSMEEVSSKKRVEEISVDAIANIRAKAAEQAAKEAEEAAKNDPNRPPAGIFPQNGPEPKSELQTKPEPEPKSEPEQDSAPEAVGDSLQMSDSLQIADSLQVADSLHLADSLAAIPAPDTTKMGFLQAYRNVRMFKKNMQAVCDSLLYCDLDSLCRLFVNPVIWNDNTHQYQADSIYLVVKDSKINKANLFANAFIHIDEGEGFHDQIRGAEMTAFFDDNGQLKRFDAMGTANAIFYLKEQDRIATANKKEATILSANFVNGEMTDVTYFENPKSDAIPVAQMKPDDKFLKGFNWIPDTRPQSPSDITTRSLRPSERDYYESRPHADFSQTEKYFKGYMAGIYRQIERSEELREENRRLRALEKARLDSLANAADSMSIAGDTLNVSGSLNVVDSLGVSDSLRQNADSLNAVSDSLAASADSLVSASDSLAVSDSTAERVLTDKELKIMQRTKQREAAAAERERKRKERQDALEKKWADQDARDALKQAAKDAKKTARRKKKDQAMIDAYRKRIEKEQAIKQKYLDKYRNKYAKKYAKKYAGTQTQ